MNRRIVRAGLAAAALFVVAACSSKGESTKPAELVDFKPSLTLKTNWRVNVGAGRGAPLQPALLENAIYAAAAEGTLMRVAPASGEILWRVDTGATLSAGVGSDGFVVAVASRRGELLTFGADGKPGWRVQLTSDVLTPPLVGRGVVVIRTTDQRVTAFEIDSGKRRWTFSRTSPPLTLRAASDLAFAGDNVLVGFPGGRLVALALGNGAPRWEAVVAEPKGSTEVERLADIVGPVVVIGRDACAAAFQGRLTCVEHANGNLRWSRELSAGGGPAFDASRAFAVDSGGAVVALSRDAGASLWRNDKLANRQLSSPAVAGGAVLVGDFKGYLHALRADSGEFAGRLSLDGAVVAPLRSWADGVIVQTQGGTLAFVTVDRP
ncbi:MAG: outer membrane protein assembly factor BamB [Betaproteobacteria bacterium]